MKNDYHIDHDADQQIDHAGRVMAVRWWAVAALMGGAAMLAVAGVISALTPQETELVATYTLDQCERVTLRDHKTDWIVTGAEDIAYDRHSQRLFVSAYDRQRTEKTAGRKNNPTPAQSLPQGGIYAIDLDTVLGGKWYKRDLDVTSLVRPDDLIGGLHPHGITLDPQTNDLVFINRRYRNHNQIWSMEPVLERISSDGAIVMGTPQPLACSANNLDISNGKTLVTLDHGACGMSAVILEDVFGLKRSKLVTLSHNEPLVSNAGFANGVLAFGDNKIALAATRDKAVYLLDDKSAEQSRPRKIRVPGGPDNLTRAYDDAIIAAVHPTLLRLGLHRKLGIGRAPSRVVRIDPDSGEITLLFDDPTGDLYMAATVGVQTQDALILGSVTDSGLLVCTR